MSDRAVSLAPSAVVRVEYQPLNLASPLAKDVLAAVTFGQVPAGADPRFVRVGLEPLGGASVMEVWRANGTVTSGSSGAIRYAADEHHLFGVLEIDERTHGGITGAAESAYSALRQFLGECGRPHLLRVWNYFDAINRGTGDEERYKQFCVGRATGLGAWPAESYPAATVIGRRDGDPRLQVYWLCGRKAGVPIDNPRQTNPHRYPRQYGPRAPQFSRAMLVGSRLVLISGTASIVGHASHHPDDVESQTAEVINNLGSVLHKASGAAPGLSVRFGAHSPLKVYLRDPAAFEKVDTALREALPTETPRIVLVGDVCRADLLVEADGVHAP